MNDEIKITVAVVDDHDFLRQELCKLIELIGFPVIFQAVNGQDALDRLGKADPLPDVCFVDVNMPVTDGFETAKAIKTEYPAIKIIAHSLDNDERSVVGMFKAGASAFLSKGCPVEDLGKAIREVHNNHNYFDINAAAAFLKFLRK